MAPRAAASGGEGAASSPSASRRPAAPAAPAPPQPCSRGAQPSTPGCSQAGACPSPAQPRDTEGARCPPTPEPPITSTGRMPAVPVAGHGCATSPAPGSSLSTGPPSRDALRGLRRCRAGGSQEHPVPPLFARCLGRGTRCSGCVRPGATTTLRGFSSRGHKYSCSFFHCSFLTIEPTPLFIRGLSEIVVLG